MSKAKQAHTWFEKALNLYNLVFFVILAVLWIYFSVTLIASEPFTLLLFWKAFNIIYSNLAFETGCIFLVLFNALYSTREMIVQYYDAKEGLGHAGTVVQFMKRKR